jgi:hypothetical protein
MESLQAELVSWRARAREWVPWGTTPIEEADLSSFLRTARVHFSRASKADILRAFGEWSACMRTFADNPLVMLQGEAAALIIHSTLVVMRRLSSANVQDEALRCRCADAEAWCTLFVRHLAGGSGSPEGCALPVDACALMEAQLGASVHELVTALQEERRPHEAPAQDTTPAMEPQSLGADLVARLARPLKQRRAQHPGCSSAGRAAAAGVAQRDNALLSHPSMMPLFRELCRHGARGSDGCAGADSNKVQDSEVAAAAAHEENDSMRMLDRAGLAHEIERLCAPQLATLPLGARGLG